MIINRNKRRRPAPLLFPQWELDRPVYAWRQTTTLTGELFEALTENVLTGVRRGTTNGSVHHCPDLTDETARLAVESKGSNRRSQFKIDPFQVDRYIEMKRQGWTAVYCLWTYGATGLRKTYKTVGKIAEAVTGSVMYLDILDASIVEAVCAVVQESELEGVRWLPSWRKSEIGTRDEYPMVLITQTFLKRLRAEPDVVLFDELGLDESQFEYSAQGQLSGKVQYTETTFDTSNFVAWQITERGDYVPF